MSSLVTCNLRLVTRCLPWLPGDLGIVGRWRAVCVTALQRPHSDAAAIGIVVYIAAASLNVTMSHELEKAFHKFAVYGSTKATGNEMTGKNFSKLCKECSIQEHGCTSTDVDIAFAKVKSKAAHAINYEQFKKAMELLSAKRFQRMPANEAIAAIHKLVEGKEPANMGTTVSAYCRLLFSAC
ncbi:unnamed protein product [Ranitomeya imitator]|uniref:Tubulin polymerization-promoting protein family member 2 n=1 Tax=Ranitomeya imitator TaxID=111125 RepID=A0ABN9M918_9NEOB|nr:unnamed protein product [Ranitomeya imitator]